jgi:hypothetical protein
MERAVRIAFWLAIVFSFVMAVLPHPPALPGEPPDKVQHIIAFSVLAALGAIAYPATSLLRLLAGLAVFGAAIELAQAIPALNRSSEFMDLVADVVAATVAGLATRWAMARLSG